jgi:hypothetical protein
MKEYISLIFLYGKNQLKINNLIAVANTSKVFFDNLCSRLSEYPESHIVAAHRTLVVLLSLTLTSFYYSGGYGVFRQMPLTFYLLGLPASNGTPRDMVPMQ